MKIIDTSLLPFPHYNNNIRIDGSMLNWPQACQNCPQRACRKTKDEQLSLCSYGYNYVKIDGITLAGFLLRDGQQCNSARKKRVRNEKQNLITKQMLELVISAIKANSDSTHKAIEDNKNSIIQKYIKKEQYKIDFLQPLKDEIQKGLSFVHDYKQINTQIRQNINVVIENRYEGEDLEEKLQKASREERAIFEASKFLDEKLNVAKYLLHPEWLNIKNECSTFNFHGMILKYRRIYSPRFNAKNIQVKMPGQSYKTINANPQAVSVIPHTLLDNAAKYSLKNGLIEIYIQDTDDAIEFSVSSFGPLIKPQEQEKIFQPFYRTKSAQKIEEEGAGYGLYISQLIAKNHLGTELKVKQESKMVPNKGYWTKFSILIPLRAVIFH